MQIICISFLEKKLEITTDLSCFIAIVELSIIFFSGIGCDDYSFFDKNIFLFPRFAIKKKTIIKFHWTKRGMIAP